MVSGLGKTGAGGEDAHSVRRSGGEGARRPLHQEPMGAPGSGGPKRAQPAPSSAASHRPVGGWVLGSFLSRLMCN